LRNNNWEPTDSWSNKAKFLVIPTSDYTSNKVDKAKDNNIPIIAIDGHDPIDVIRKHVRGL